MREAREALARAIDALTYDQIERYPLHLILEDDGSLRPAGPVQSGKEIPLLDRSIAHDLIRIEKSLAAQQPTLLSAIAHSIDEALLAIAEAQRVLGEAMR
ncbi:hypothetical protein [Novosphingobium sp. NDB2Meth1]|uniref:hypothetical protein n=1 Tax=Novosphingobium sp. NDB2Meth1 TaxID=1892847 RepID=UPI000931492F|nr:hypothetical protein [Novosphingobium sp. NDB2Meth1]